MSLTITCGIFPSDLPVVLLLADLLQPIDNLTVLLFLNCDVRHGRSGRCAVPVLLTRREPDHIAGADFLDRPTFTLRPTAARRNDQSLTERMRVPRGTSTRLKSYAGALNKRRIGRLKKRIDPTVPVNQSAGPLPEGCEPALLISIRNFLDICIFYLHMYVSGGSKSGYRVSDALLFLSIQMRQVIGPASLLVIG